MAKLILFLIIIGIIYFIFKSKKKKTIYKEPPVKDLIMCEKCKTFYTKNEILKIDGKNICKECYDNS
jgi:uncharacterized protein